MFNAMEINDKMMKAIALKEAKELAEQATIEYKAGRTTEKEYSDAMEMLRKEVAEWLNG